MKERVKIANGMIYLEGKLQKKTLIIENGVIVDILDEDNQADFNGKVIDCRGKHVLPGTMDTHVHIREPGSEERETFFTGTMAAAAGGVTTVFEHPISKPPPYNETIFKNRLALADQQIVVDCCLYGALGTDSLDQVPRMKELGIISYKTFLQEPMKGRELEFEGLTISDDYHLLRAMEEGAEHDVLLAFHAENDDIIQGSTQTLIENGRVDVKAHYESRPVIAEIESISKLLLLAEHTNARIEICHVSSAEALKLLREAKKKGISVIVETCPQFMFNCEEDVLKLGVYAKCNPPIRPKAGLEAIWECVNDGTVDIIGSDHAPYTLEEKQRGKENIFMAPAGFPGIETRVPLMLDAVNKKRVSLERFVELMSENPARLFRIDHRKGYIRKGFDADLIVVDMNKEYTIDKHKMHTKRPEVAEIYHGREITGTIERVLVRGKVVMEEGRIKKDAAGYGEIIKPKQ